MCIVPNQQAAVEVVHVVPVGDCVDQKCDVTGRGQCFGWRVGLAEADAGMLGVLGIYSIINRNGPDPLDAQSYRCTLCLVPIVPPLLN